MVKNRLNRVVFGGLLAVTLAGASLGVLAEPLKGGIKEEGDLGGGGGSKQSALLDQLQQQLQELKALNARLEKATLGGGTSTAVFPMKIDAVDNRFKPNKLFAEASLPQEDTEDGWYKIPYWRAGKYHREKQVDHSITGDVTIVSRVDHVYGMQKDKSGGIWHHRSWPHITRVETDKYNEYKIIEKYEPIEGKPNEFAFKVRSTDIDVSKTTNKIARVTKQEEIHRYTPGPDGSAVGEIEWQGYTANGDPNTQVERSSVEEEQVEAFRVVDFWKKKDLKTSFQKYLQSHGMADLIPED